MSAPFILQRKNKFSVTKYYSKLSSHKISLRYIWLGLEHMLQIKIQYENKIQNMLNYAG